MDPWRDCRRRFEEHFADRMKDRSLPKYQVELALLEGDKYPMPPSDEANWKGYRVLWNSWVLIVYVGKCVLRLRTAYLVS